jgi:hypothetical protein
MKLVHYTATRPEVRVEQMLDPRPEHWPDCYRPEAEIVAADLEEAYRLAQGEEESDNYLPPRPHPRAACTGDVFAQPNNTAYMILQTGYCKLQHA